MTDLENREILRTALDLLKNQMLYVRNLHDAFGALEDAVARVDPQVKKYVQEEMKVIRLNPVQQEHIDALDALLQRLA
ncbi:MAG: hypothetical protein WAL45_21240 [Terracidiphilus sp.]|jgi:hypothetical protein